MYVPKFLLSKDKICKYEILFIIMKPHFNMVQKQKCPFWQLNIFGFLVNLETFLLEPFQNDPYSSMKETYHVKKLSNGKDRRRVFYSKAKIYKFLYFNTNYISKKKRLRMASSNG